MVKTYCIAAPARPSRLPARARGRSWRASEGFSLLELTVMVVLVSLLVSGAALYYREVAASSRLSIAQEELHRIRDEIHRWGLVPGRKAPARTSDLPRLGGEELFDPWGQTYHIQPADSRILSSGPNRILETGAGTPPGGDDLVVRYFTKLAPPSSPPH
jgi:hypothetical protein